MMFINFARQLGIFNPNEFKDIQVQIIGAGAVGSMTTLLLSKMGFKNIEVWDFDKVKDHNLPNQMFPESSLGSPKVLVLKEFIKLMTGAEIDAKNKRFTAKDADYSNTVLVVAVDSMDERIKLWKSVKGNPAVRVYVDPRMGGELMRIYTLVPELDEHCKRYEKTLYTSKEAERLPCTARSIIYNLAGVSGFILSNIKKVLLNQPYHNETIFDYKTDIHEKEAW